jgi:hypothetical protein
MIRLSFGDIDHVFSGGDHVFNRHWQTVIWIDLRPDVVALVFSGVNTSYLLFEIPSMVGAHERPSYRGVAKGHLLLWAVLLARC